MSAGFPDSRSRCWLNHHLPIHLTYLVSPLLSFLYFPLTNFPLFSTLLNLLANLLPPRAHTHTHTLLAKCIKERIWEFHIQRVEFMQILIFKIPITAHISHSILNWWIKSDSNHLSVECWDRTDPLLPQQTMMNSNKDVFHFMQH